MHSTRSAAHRAAIRSSAGVLLALALTLTLTTTAHAAHYRGGCANRLCTRYVPHTPSCWRLHHRAKVARCFIARAAARYAQPRSQAYAIAWRESRYHWRITNTSSGAAGLFQFMPVTWAHSPYRHHSPYNPRWAALAAMWYWAHGGYHHWRV
jgi:NAD(P)-dependent dehydrogenase (short-subunit alcohol dehydrogenase family)